MFKYGEGTIVALKDDNPTLGLKAGDRGTVWALYDVRPPAYEVTFQSHEGGAFDTLVGEDELTAPTTEEAPARRATVLSAAGAHIRHT